MLYDGYATKLAERIQRRLDEMVAHHNFEYGAEFEIALCRLLRSVLPDRCGICRGYVVPEQGPPAGDDIIIYDAFRFPTLRALDQQLELKEQVPADAVLAYIEAKHSLYTRPVTRKQEKHGGQCITKALDQVRDVKSLVRADVPLSNLAPGVYLSMNATVQSAPGVEIKMDMKPVTPEGYPKVRNPWFAMILAKNLRVGRASPRDALFGAIEAYAAGLTPTRDGANQGQRLPDVIAAGNVLIFPVLSPVPTSEAGRMPDARWFLTDTTELVAVESALSPIAMSFIHMFMAIESMLLSQLPIGKLMQEAIDPNHTIQWRKGSAKPVR